MRNECKYCFSWNRYLIFWKKNNGKICFDAISKLSIVSIGSLSLTHIPGFFYCISLNILNSKHMFEINSTTTHPPNQAIGISQNFPTRWGRKMKSVSRWGFSIAYSIHKLVSLIIQHSWSRQPNHSSIRHEFCFSYIWYVEFSPTQPTVNTKILTMQIWYAIQYTHCWINMKLWSKIMSCKWRSDCSSFTRHPLSIWIWTILIIMVQAYFVDERFQTENYYVYWNFMR